MPSQGSRTDESLRRLGEQVRKLRKLMGATPEGEAELQRIEERTRALGNELMAVLPPIERVRMARHPERPYSLDYIERLFEDWVELRGDRGFRDDPAIVAGLARYHGRSVVVVAHQKGRGTRGCLHRNFGMAHPEGYRKATRLYQLAERFGKPIITFIDTPGAFPGIEAEERGQSEAIGHALEVMAGLGVPIVSAVIGEGGSGGALALGVCNRLLMLELAYYSVITPEGCAAILWRDPTRTAEAAEQLHLTPNDLLRLGMLDTVVKEPLGGAHRDHDEAARLLDHALQEALLSLDGLSPDELREDRYRRFRNAGAFLE